MKSCVSVDEVNDLTEGEKNKISTKNILSEP
jgi:hypothetical protein